MFVEWVNEWVHESSAWILIILPFKNMFKDVVFQKIKDLGS